MTNSPDRPEQPGQVSVFQSPHCASVLLADIATRDQRGALGWSAIPHDSALYRCAIEDYRAGILSTVNYLCFLDCDGNPI